MARNARIKNKGFTLVELSIVLVILALLVAAVIGGQSLIRAAELRGVITDANLYITAINNFKQQYRYLPGDFNRATSYWADPDTAHGLIVHNGDGDGRVGLASGDERFYAWQHLNLAGFVEGNYTGATGSGGPNDFVTNQKAANAANIPSARLSNSGFAFYYADNSAGSNYVYVTPAANVLGFGASAGTDGGPPNVVIITPQDAYTIDTKVDDGMPGTGLWIANMTGGHTFASGNGCTKSTSNSDYTGNFQMTLTSNECSFFIYGGW